MLYYLLLLSAAIIGLFVPYSLFGTSLYWIVQAFVFISISYSLFKLYKQNETKVIQEVEKPHATPVTQLKPLIEVKKPHIQTAYQLSQILTDSESQIGSYLLNQFDIFFNFILPNNGYVYIANSSDDIRLFYKQISPNIRWQSNNNVPTILNLLQKQEKNILIENNLTTESDLIPYYEQESYFPGSIIAFKTPVTAKQNIFWVFDALPNGFFNPEELHVPNQISYATQFVLGDYIQKLEKNLCHAHMDSKLGLAMQFNRANTLVKAIDIFIEHVAQLFVAQKLSVCFRDENNPHFGTVVKTIGQNDSVKQGNRFELEQGLTGKVILANKTYLLDDIERDGYFIPRFSQQEKSNFNIRSYLAVPLKLEAEAVGVIVLENTEVAAFTKKEKILLEELSKLFSFVLQRFYN